MARVTAGCSVQPLLCFTCGLTSASPAHECLCCVHMLVAMPRDGLIRCEGEGLQVSSGSHQTSSQPVQDRECDGCAHSYEVILTVRKPVDV